MAGERKQRQRHVFYWCRLEDEAHGRNDHKIHATVTCREVAEQNGVPHDTLVKHLQKKIDEANMCRSLTIALVMVISFMGVTVAHSPVVPVIDIEEAIDVAMLESADFAFVNDEVAEKDIQGIQTWANLWSWIKMGLVPLAFPEEEPNMTRTERGILLSYNHIIGGVRLRQEIAPPEECRKNVKGAKDLRNCALGDRRYELRPQMPRAVVMVDPQKEQWLWSIDGPDKALDDLVNLETMPGGWINTDTLKLEAALPVYNPEHAVYTLICINFYFARGGHIWKRVLMMSTYAKWFDIYTHGAVDAIWCVSMVCLVAAEIYKIRMLVAVEGWAGFKRQYFSLWPIVFWTIIGVGFGIVVGFLLRYLGSESLNADLVRLGETSRNGDEVVYQSQVMAFTSKLEREVHGVITFRIVVGLYPLLLMIWLFESYLAQPRLAVVPKTIGGAMTDLVHFLLVFMSIFMTYAVAGVVLFGREVDDFTTMLRAMGVTFRTMMGEFDWPALAEVGRIEAGIWLVSFLILVGLLMLNMLLAIVMDAYNVQKADIQRAEAIWTQAVSLLKRLHGERKGSVVKLKTILKAVIHSEDQFKVLKRSHSVGSERGSVSVTKSLSGRGTTSVSGGLSRSGSRSLIVDSLMNFAFGTETDKKEEGDRIVKFHILQKACPELTKEQAMEVFEETLEQYYHEHEPNAKTKDMLKTIQKLDAMTRRLKLLLKRALGAAHKHVKVNDLLRDLADRESNGGRSKLPADTSHLTLSEEVCCCYPLVQDAKDWIGPVALEEPPKDWVRESPLQSLEEAAVWSVRKIRDDDEAVMQACRDAGIGSAKDEARQKALGLITRIVRVDPTDMTVCCRVPALGDIWFGLGALTYPYPEDLPDSKGKEDIITHEEITKKAMAMLSGHGADPKRRQGELRAHELQSELALGKTTVSEAMEAVTELEGRLARERAERQKVVHKFDDLKRKVLALTRHHRKIREAIKKQEDKIAHMNRSKEEFSELKSALAAESVRLKQKLGQLSSMTSPRPHSSHRSERRQSPRPVREHRGATDLSALEDRLASALQKVHEETAAASTSKRSRRTTSRRNDI